MIIGSIAIGVAACILYCTVTGVIGGIGAGVRWAWRAIKPLRQRDFGLAG
ncbi:hypothetical protein [Actinoplanes sp. NPDC049316]